MAKTRLWAGQGQLCQQITERLRQESLATCRSLTTMTSNDAQCDDFIVRDYQTVTCALSRVS